jgi:ergothioneine biosynthesis protein EgtB
MQLLDVNRAGLPTMLAEGTASLADRFLAVRRFTEALCETLVTEDYVVQSMADVSPTKWHLAHTSWFFETFILVPHAEGYALFHEDYPFLFNSYYVQAGERHCRAQRGYLSRPTVAEVYRYRAHVDQHLHRLLATADAAALRKLAPLVEIGLHHEQQHQELLVTDIKHVLSVNPLRPVFRESAAPPSERPAPALEFVPVEEGLYEIGHAGDTFSYDNESPRHRVYLRPYALANRLVTCGEYLEFMRDGGYERPELWLSLGWATVQEEEWTEPFYWERHEVGGESAWKVFTLGGLRDLDPEQPVSHLSYFEADAYARWSGARLPTEAEWEVAAEQHAPRERYAGAEHANFVEDGRFHPATPASGAAGPLLQMYGDVWEWTRSQYEPYPGYRPAPGALGEYNGKFMCNQFVLRGGSCATSRVHIRPTYRNFFPPESTWQFTGLRLAKDI